MNNVAGVLLIGGLSRRMNGTNKGLLDLGGKPLLAHGLERLRCQVSTVAINANHDLADMEQFGVPVIRDPVEGYQGPLAGLLAGMDWAAETVPDADWLMTVAGDTPFFPEDLVDQLKEMSEGAGVVLAESDGFPHPVFGLWRLELREALRTFLAVEETRKVRVFSDRHNVRFCPIEPVILNGHQIDPFYNINRPEDLADAQRMLSEKGPVQ